MNVEKFVKSKIKSRSVFSLNLQKQDMYENNNRESVRGFEGLIVHINRWCCNSPTTKALPTTEIFNALEDDISVLIGRLVFHEPTFCI